jgi:hypothetical protein
MKKLYTLFLFAAFGIQAGSGQILEAIHPVLNYAGPNNVKLTALADITNNGPNSLDVLAERYIQNMSPGHYSYFCWTVCYDTSTYISPSAVTIASGGTYSLFEGWAGTDNTPGHDEVTYRYYDMNGNSDTLYLVFTYDFNPTGIKEYYANKYGLVVSGPNPAHTFTTVNYSSLGQKEGKLIISNLLGSKVDEYRLSPKTSTQSVPVSNLKAGIYIMSLVVDGIVTSSKKLIVAHP